MLPPSLDEVLRKSNLVPFGDVVVTNHPNTPPIPMTLPMVHLVPVSKDEVTGEARYKLLVPRTGHDLPLNFPPFFPLHSPPLLPGLAARFPEQLTAAAEKKQQRPEVKTPNGKTAASATAGTSLSLKVECNDLETTTSTSAPLDLTHRSPTSGSSASEAADPLAEAELGKAKKGSSSSSPEHKLGSDIEEHLQFLKVKQMEFLKQAAESVQNRCNECNINFSKYQNYVAHKKYYCSGQKSGQAQDSDTEDSPPPQQAASAPAKKQTPLSSPSSPPFSPSTQNLALAKQNIFNQEFFLNQKSLLEAGLGPGKLPLLMTPPVLNMQQPNTSHFVCQGCGIKFKSLSNLKAHQSRYCSGIKSTEDTAAAAAVGAAPPQMSPSLEALLKSQLSGSGPAAPPLAGLSAADMITLLSAQHMAASAASASAATADTKAAASPPSSSAAPPPPPALTRGKSPKLSTDPTPAPATAVSPGTGAGPSKPETKEDFCLVLCGFKESAVDLNKLKEQFNMQFIGQVKKRKSEGEADGEVDEDGAPAAEDDIAEEPVIKRVKKEDGGSESVARMISTPEDSDSLVNPRQESEGKEHGMKCSNCNISFVNATTFRAHVNFYCKKRNVEQE